MTLSPDTVVYLAGKVLKGNEIGRVNDWRKQYVESLSPIKELRFLSPDDPSLDEGDPEMIFGHDCHLVTRCDIVIVNATTKLGVGTAQEMLLAKYFEKYVLTVLPPDSHHRRSNLEMHGKTVADWIHPFVFSTSDAIFASLEELVDHLAAELPALRSRAPKNMTYIEGVIERYRQSSHADLEHV
ncbi:hypothetical protein [Actinoplanes solisilvae]|uniref:hypothetical protein n=1 Tax=Actinoplanes solisilvae TaxID=2486853 RepID=UPI000FDAC18D|nr:hypothetical protein [Actinoplanes solisilvae]